MLKVIAEIISNISELRRGHKEIMATLKDIDASLTSLQTETATANSKFTDMLSAIDAKLASEGNITEADLDLVKAGIDQATVQTAAFTARISDEITKLAIVTTVTQ